ncbi:transcription elongation factor S-II [Xylaria arbuscula]|nr:transcription elongation factor S-II [Xylaria arbuscula]
MPNPTRTNLLLEAAKAFCDSFAQKKPIEEILSHFSSSSSSSSGREDEDEDGDSDGSSRILVHEHGLAQLAPFLGRDYRGREGARRYFETVAGYLSYEDMRFVEFVVDGGDDDDEEEEEEGERGKRGGKVADLSSEDMFWESGWTETKQSWDETFVYVLAFDGEAKLERYEVWADSGAAYLASRGELRG